MPPPKPQHLSPLIHDERKQETVLGVVGVFAEVSPLSQINFHPCQSRVRAHGELRFNTSPAASPHNTTAQEQHQKPTLCQLINSAIYILNSQQPFSALYFSHPQKQKTRATPKIPKPLRRPSKNEDSKSVQKGKASEQPPHLAPPTNRSQNHRYTHNTSKRTVPPLVASLSSLFPLPLSVP